MNGQRGGLFVLGQVTLLLTFGLACSDDSTGAVDSDVDIRDARSASDRAGVGDAAGDEDAVGLDGDGREEAPLADGGGDGDAVMDGQGEDGGAVDDLGDRDDPSASVECDGLTAYTGTVLVDLNGDPFEPADRVRVTVELLNDGTTDVSGTLSAFTTNLSLIDGSERRDDEVFSDVTVSGPNVVFNLADLAPARYSFEAEIVSDDQLITVFAHLEGTGCMVGRSYSGVALQVVGGEFKIPFCVDMTRFRSIQIAPPVALQSTAAYAAANGSREDLWADDFIFCPQNPTIVHVAEFCVDAEAGQAVTLAGSYRADDAWEVDDFALVEVFDVDSPGTLLADGFTTQTHPGGDTFWCPEIESLVCTEGCQASLTDTSGTTDREITPLAVTSALGEHPRSFDDGSVSITSLLPAGGGRADLRVTFLDVGIEGELSPALYLIAGD